jgi:hypothetical protein
LDLKQEIQIQIQMREGLKPTSMQKIPVMLVGVQVMRF